MFKLKFETPEEYKEWCKIQIKEHGLYGAIDSILNEVIVAHQNDDLGMGQLERYSIVILDLIETFGEGFGIYKVEDEHNVVDRLDL